MKLRNKLGILGISLLAFACTDLDTKNSDYLLADQYPENQEQAIRVANPVFARTQGHADWGGWWFLQEITSDEATAPTRGGDWDDGGKWRALHQHSWGVSTEAVEQMYRFVYETMPRANRAIELLELGAEADPAVQKVLSQTIVARAYFYYLAIDNFGDVAFPRTFTGADEFPSRTPRAEVFNAIVQDIKDNIEFLPNPTAGVSSSSINKGTAYALLAKLYLNAEVYTGTPMWQETIDACDMLMTYGYALDGSPKTPFLSDNASSKENIYTVPYDEDTFTGFNLHMRTLNYQNQLTFGMGIQPWNGFATLEAFYNTFTANDARKYALLEGQQYDINGAAITDADAEGANLVLTPNIPALLMPTNGFSKQQIRMSGVRVVKWEIPVGARENLSTDLPLFRLADFILMKAEAQVRLGGAGAGDALVNEIKGRSNAPITGGYNLDDILAERGREMMWEGHRRQDLIRFGKFNNTWWEKTNTDPNRKLFPIPQFAINANSNLLPQNPGY